jgi:cytolysin (calcineurin-like family phosphatase)
MKNVLRCAACLWVAAWPTLARDVTFLATSDSHYRQPDHKLGHHNFLNQATVDEMNAVTNANWPGQRGGDPIRRPRGVVVPGDLIDDGDHALGGRRISEEQFEFFRADFGLDGTDGRLRFPVFEGWGNHDGPPAAHVKNGFSVQAQIRDRTAVRLQRGLVQSVSSNGLHYAWDWDDVRFVQLNFYPADRQREGVRYSPIWHDPQGALSFLRADLAARVGASGRPVVLISHCGYDTDWWTKEDWRELYEAMRPYRIALHVFGHTGTGLWKWAPEGETNRWDCLNDGQTEKGFFVIQLTDHRLRAAMRIKTGVQSRKQAGGRLEHTWGGEWEWKWLFEKPLAPPQAHLPPG